MHTSFYLKERDHFKIYTRQKNSINMSLKQIGWCGMVWNGFNWLKIHNSSGLFYT